MKASELIKALEAMVASHGDKQVCILADEFLFYHKVESVSLRNREKNEWCKADTRYPFFIIE